MPDPDVSFQIAAIVTSVAIGLGVGRVGVMQVREFRERSGDRSWFTALLGLTFLGYHDHPARSARQKRSID